jgi:triacylglycerol esterase/lipase EstA (alpha/beta hydrolase family)
LKRIGGTQVHPHPVILVHGILGQEIVYWNRVKQYLRGDRYHVHEAPFPFFGFGDLRASAAHLAKVVDELLAHATIDPKHRQVDIIAHSAGGLAARYFIKYLGGAHKVHSLVTLGTPHQGTYFSFLFPLATVVRQTLPGSEFLADLNRGGATNGVEYTSIYSPTDGIVVPAHNAMMKGARNVRVTGLTHWGFLFRKKVYMEIRKALDHERPDPPVARKR